MSPRPAMTMILAEWAAGLRFVDLPTAVVHHAKRVILDFLAATLAGSTSEPALIVQQYLSETEQPGSANVFGTPLKLTPPHAAMANGTAAHGLEVDDGFTPGAYHPGAPTLAAILAAAEHHQSTGEDILLATVVGYELSCRLAGAGHPSTWANGFHNTPVAGVFGAAAGVTKLLGGQTADLANALGLAGSHAGGLFEFLERGADVKRYHAGKAARDGLVSADLATRGLTGPTTVLEGENGYGHAFASDRLDADFLLDGLSADWNMLRTYVKPYPCCRHLHGPIDAVLALRKQTAPDQVELTSATVETYPVAARHDQRAVESLLDAQMSIPYAVAVTLLAGAPSLEHFGLDWRREPRIAELMGMVEVTVADDCARDYPAMRPARVTLRGPEVQLSHRIDQPYGEPSNPVSDLDLERKFARLATPVVGPRRAQEIVAMTWSFAEPRQLFVLLDGGEAMWPHRGKSEEGVDARGKS